jgi:hypothetical protein
VGETTGRGKDSTSKKANRSIKQILVLPLHRRFRQLLQSVAGSRPDGLEQQWR